MHGRRNLRDFYRTIKELSITQNMLLTDISHISHTLHSARHAKVTQSRVQSSGKRAQEGFSALKTRGGFSQLSVPKSVPSTQCPVILGQL